MLPLHYRVLYFTLRMTGLEPALVFTTDLQSVPLPYRAHPLFLGAIGFEPITTVLETIILTN